jgi:hypothetical protein
MPYEKMSGDYYRARHEARLAREAAAEAERQAALAEMQAACAAQNAANKAAHEARMARAADLLDARTVEIPDHAPIKVGGLGNTYGDLELRRAKGQDQWSVEDYTGHDWEPCDPRIAAILRAAFDPADLRAAQLRAIAYPDSLED